MKLLISHDGSPQSDSLLAELSRCGLPATGEAIVLSVADAWTAVEGDAAPAFTGAIAGVGAATIRAAMDEAARISTRARDEAAARLPGWTVTSESVAGSPAWEIIRRSEEWPADLVLIGATGTSRLERIVFGTTTSQVVGHATCSVRACRPRQGASGPVRLVLGCDGSEPSAAAARTVAARSWPAGSRVRIVTALDNWLLAALSQDGATESDLQGEAERLPETVAPLLRAAGLEVESVVREGDPKRLLLEEAEGWNADCIYVGARGRSGLARLLLGSVAVATSSRARCSVEIVRAART